jgi:exonuclease SbcC
MAELDALREGGRLVGIISHVPTLRERISGGIEVTKTSTGSDARVVVLAEV